MEIVVDADNEVEMMGWYYYLDNQLQCPFKARWIGLSEGETVEVLGMSSIDDCTKALLVEVLYREETLKDVFSARLYDIEPIDADEETQQAIADWHYWVDRGYEFIEE